MLPNTRSQKGYTQNRGGRNAQSGMRGRANKGKKTFQKDTPTNVSPDVKPENEIEEAKADEPKAIETPEDKPEN
jgi:hypothetical protein|tara:strand:- start:256 stop:477 length:222 start_codon:yes stop_codon:yes gene_type:complete